MNRDSKSIVSGRRKVLGSIASAGALFGLCNLPEARSQAENRIIHTAENCDLFSDAVLKNYKNGRSSSWDRTGGNNDSVKVPAGQSATLLDLSGAGVVTHIWFTINSWDALHLKNIVLRAWWDGESTPSIECPIGDFFGLGLGDYFVFESKYLAAAPMKALNSYFQMPFAKAARITVTNEGPSDIRSLYYAFDYVRLAELPAGLGRFHAQYRQASPCKGWTADWINNGSPGINTRSNLDGAGNYVFLEAVGKGHFLGLTQAVEQNQEGWFGEGDDMIFIDGDTQPTINGTGTEDYFNGAWGYGKQVYSQQRIGVPFMVNPEKVGGCYCQYRWHTESPLAFEKSIRVTIEHGHANHRSDNFYSVAYWYQTEPHAVFPVLPAPTDRAPRVFAVGGGAGPAEMPKR